MHYSVIALLFALLALSRAVEIDHSGEIAEVDITDDDFTALLEAYEEYSMFNHTEDEASSISTMGAFGAPLYKQCDSRWGGNRIGLGSCSRTICQVGCAMSSVAMYISKRGGGVNPGTLNSFLRSHGGYSGCNIYWGAVNGKGGVKYIGKQKPSYQTSCNSIKKGSGLVANVNGGRHWVLLTGCKGNGVFTVNDPGYTRSTYKQSEILEIAVYH